MADKSLDEIIRERNIPGARFGRGRGAGGRGGGRGSLRGGGVRGGVQYRGGGAGRGGGRGRGNNAASQSMTRGQNRGRGNWQQQPRRFQQQGSITDARDKLVQKAHLGDARDRLAQKARLTDARVKLSTRRKSAPTQPQPQAPAVVPTQAQPYSAAAVGLRPQTQHSGSPISRTVANMGSPQITVPNPSQRSQTNKTQITIPNSQRQSPKKFPAQSPQRSANPILAGASTLRVTKAVPQAQKRPAPAPIDYPHFGDDLHVLPTRSPVPPKVQRMVGGNQTSHHRTWISDQLHAHASTVRTVPQGTRLLISNLQTSVTEDDIKELFGAVGEILKARMVRSGIAEVVFVNRTEALQAISTYHNRELDGKPMICKLDTSTIPEASGTRTTPNALSNRFKSLRTENNPKLPFETMPKGAPSGIDADLVHQALFKKNASAAAHKPVVFTVKI